MLKKNGMLMLVLTCTILLINEISSEEKGLDSGVEILYSLYQAETAKQLPERTRITSSVVTQISVESDISSEYSESVEDENKETPENENHEDYSQLSQSSEGEASQETKKTLVPRTNSRMVTETMVKTSVSLANPTISMTEQDDNLQEPTVVEHSISSDEIDVNEPQPQPLNSKAMTTAVTPMPGSEKDVVIVSSVQTSKSMEAGEISYEEYNSQQSEEENPSASLESEQVSTIKPRIIELVVTSTSVLQEEMNANEMELQLNTNHLNEMSVETTTEMSISQLDYISSPVTIIPVTVPSETTGTIIYFEQNSTFSTAETDKNNKNNKNNDTTLTSSNPPSPTTSPSQLVVVTSFSTTSTESETQTKVDAEQNLTLATTQNEENKTANVAPLSEKPIGKSLKANFDSQSIMTEDQTILAKLIPPSTTPAEPEDKEKSVKIKTFTDKQGKTYTLKLLTEDPSVLAAMTPPPAKNQTNKVVKSFFHKTLGKNITLKLLTEDPSILAAMTPPSRPRPRPNTTSFTTSKLKLAPKSGAPQQVGKLPIITRNNGTRKPFLRTRASPRYTRPPPNFKKLSDIVNRSRIISTRRPSYLMKQAHEGEYQQDPDKRRIEQVVSVTTIRTTTTLSPIFRWGKYVAVSGNLKIVNGADWSEELRNPSTAKFKQLANEIEEKLDKIFRYSSLSASQYKGVEVDSFSKGSVLVDYTLYLKEDTRGSIQEMIKTAYRSGLENGTYLASFKVDPLYAMITPENILPPQSTEEAIVFPHWAIPIVGSGIAAIVFLIILCVIRKCSAQSAKRKYGAPLTNDGVQENKKSTKNGYDNPVMEGVYDLDNVYNEKAQQRPIPYHNSTTSIYSNGSRSSHRNSKPNGKIQGYKRNDGDNSIRDVYNRNSFRREPSSKQKKNSSYDAWGEWEDFYDTRQQNESYYGRNYDSRQERGKDYESRHEHA
uniref:SEA domain-containing protein n=1 Tax=Strigamia maritima TaxID=126957 RepID=T1J7D7_STRMM